MRLPVFFLFILFAVILFQIPCEAQYSRHESVGFSPTAFNLKKGENRFSSTMILFNSYDRGLTDNLSMSFNLTGLVGGSTSLKYTHSLNDFIHIGLTPIIGFDLDDNDGYIHPRLAATLTIGTSDVMVNFVYGKGVDIEQVKSYPGPVKNIEFTNSNYFYAVSSSFRISEKFTMSLDHFFERDRNLYGVLTYMLRYELKDKHLIQGGFGLFTESYEEFGTPRTSILPIPLLSYSYFWGLKKPRKVRRIRK